MVVIKVNYTSDAPIIKVNYDDAPIYISTTVDATYISVDYGSGAATNAVWGDITGTLSDQTDLQNALDDKVPYTGATANVDLGEYELKAGQLTLDVSPTGTAAVGTTRWNNTIGSSETTLKGGSVILKNGVDLVARVVNKVSPNQTLTKAQYQAVRVSGAQGQRLAVALAQANNDNNSADTIGLVTETIATNQEGFIMTVGQLEGINTTGSLQSETWSDGDVIYLSPTTAGALTNVKPIAPQHIIVIGYVEYAHQNNGKLYVKVMNGWELGELHDVDTTGATNGQVLAYDSALSIWKPTTNGSGTVSSVGLTSATSGITITGSPVTSSGNLNFEIATASGSATGLLSSTDWTTFNNKQNALTNPITGTGASGQVAYWSGTNTQSGENNLFWDAANNRLGVVTSTPRGSLDVIGNFYLGSNTILADAGSVTTINQTAYYPIVFRTNNTERVRIFETGNFGINTGATDSGQRLQVNGDTLLKGSGNTSGSTALTVQNSSSTNIFRVYNNQLVAINSTDAGGYNGSLIVGLGVSTSRLAMIGSLEITAGADGIWTGQYLRADGANRVLKIGLSNTNVTDNNALLVQAGGFSAGQGFSSKTTGLIEWALFDNASFSPTSGTAVFNQFVIRGAINQTGGANGITRGLYVNPTLTAAADWRSIEWSNNTGWGLYGAGTANNLLNGNLGLGLTPTHRLSIGDITLGTGAGAANEVQFGRSNANAIFRAGQSGTNSGAFAWIYNATAASAFLEIGTFGNNNRININGSQLRLNPTGNILVNSTSDTGEKFQVTGTAKITGASSFGGNMTLSLNQNAETSISISNTTAGTNAITRLNLTSDSTAGSARLFKYSSLNTGYKTIAASDFGIFNITAGDISILNDFATGNIKFAAGGSSTFHWRIQSAGHLEAADAENLIFGTTTGTKIGTATSQKIGFWNATPIVQPTTAVASATRVGGGGTTLTDTDTFDGYTLAQVVKALRNAGLLA
jgi:hypothetical protein